MYRVTDSTVPKTRHLYDYIGENVWDESYQQLFPYQYILNLLVAVEHVKHGAKFVAAN